MQGSNALTNGPLLAGHMRFFGFVGMIEKTPSKLVAAAMVFVWLRCAGAGGVWASRQVGK